MSADCSHKSGQLTLVMGGSEERLQLVLGQPGPDGVNLLASCQWTVPGKSIRFLMPGLKQTLDSLGLTMDAIGKIACIHGPGSFTGLRLVLAAAQGLAAGSGALLAGLDYLPLLASGPAPLLEERLHVLTYARRGLVYMQSFTTPALEEIFPLTSLPLEEAARCTRSQGNTACLMGSGLRKNPDFFADLAALNPDYTLLPAQWDNPSPELLLKAAATASYSEGPIEPVYVRPTDAEDNLPHIARKLGLDPDEARRRLDELQHG